MYTTYVSVSARISSVRRVSSRIFTKNYKIVKHAMTFRSIRVLNSNTHTLSFSLSLSLLRICSRSSRPRFRTISQTKFSSHLPDSRRNEPQVVAQSMRIFPFVFSSSSLHSSLLFASFLVSIRPNYSLTLVLASLVRPTFRSCRHSRVLCGSEEKTCNIPISF